MPAEVEIRDAGFSETQKIGVALAVLSENNQEYLIEWIKDVSD